MMNLAATCCILLAYLSLSGCLHSVRLPDAADGDAIRTGERTIVLFRHQSRYDSKPSETLGTYPMKGFGFEMGSLDEDDKPLAPADAVTMGGLVDWRDLGGGYPPGAIAAAYLLFYLPPAALGGPFRGTGRKGSGSPARSVSSGRSRALSP